MSVFHPQDFVFNSEEVNLLSAASHRLTNNWKQISQNNTKFLRSGYIWLSRINLYENLFKTKKLVSSTLRTANGYYGGQSP